MQDGECAHSTCTINNNSGAVSAKGHSKSSCHLQTLQMTTGLEGLLLMLHVMHDLQLLSRKLLPLTRR
jgi:hypothetical protein